MSEAATPSPPASAGLHPYEAILRMCAMAAPHPWYPRAYARSAGVSVDGLYYYVEHLWLDGLVQKAEGAPEAGPGLTLTPAGREVLDDPAALARLKAGRAVVQGDRGGIVREVIRRSEKPIASRIVLGVNVAWFLYSVYLASAVPGGAVDFLTYPLGSGGANIDSVLTRSGAISGELWLQGQSWRLATACFVHIGLLHLVMNMYFLFQVGKYVEQMWGRLRFLIIYALAGLGGSCLSVALMPEALMAGASGALCGIIAAEAVWVLCNGKYLPRGLVSRWRGNLVFNAMLLVGISMMHNVSWAGHLGGALTGAAVALVMQVQRFGSWPWNWAALALLLPLPWLGYALIDHEQAVNPAWNGLFHLEERNDFQDNYLKRIEKSTQTAYGIYLNERAALNQPPDERDERRVLQAKKNLNEQHENVQQLAEELAQAGPYKDPIAERARRTAVEYVDALADLLATARSRLSTGSAWTPEDEAKAKKARALHDAWEGLLRPK